MARKKNSKTPRRRNTAVSLTGVAEAVMLANVGTQAAFNLSAWEFVTDGWQAGSSSATATGQLSLYEMIYGNKSKQISIGYGGGTTTTTTLTAGSNADIVMENLKNNWLPAAISSVAIPVGFRVGRKLLRRPITMGNKLLKQAGLRGMVKI